jgi:hypothetical protein
MTELIVALRNFTNVPEYDCTLFPVYRLRKFAGNVGSFFHKMLLAGVLWSSGDQGLLREEKTLDSVSAVGPLFRKSQREM